MYTDDIEKNFVSIALRKSFVTSLQVYEALKIREQENIEGRLLRDIAAIMAEKGHMNASQIDEVLLEMNIPTI